MNIRTQGTQKEAKVFDIRKDCTVLQYHTEYDTTHPEETIRDFVDAVKYMIFQYDYNSSRIHEIELELIDLEHYIEIADKKRAPEGYKLYSLQKELRMERRERKNENEILKPVYECFHGTGLLSKMSDAQGKVRMAKSTIDTRVYTVKTGILDEYLGKAPEKIGLNLLTGETCVMEG